MALAERIGTVPVRVLVSADGSTRAGFVPEWGGTGYSLRVPSPAGPRELLHADGFFRKAGPGELRGGSPFLFPACGRLERDGEPGLYLHGGRRYRMPIHGFAPYAPWEECPGPGPDELTLRLTDTPSTRRMFPFAFELTLSHRVEPGGLVSRHTLRNTGADPMPFSLGFHPYLRTPRPGGGKDRVRVSVPARRRLLYNERLTDLTGDGPALPMPASACEPALHESLHEIEPAAACRLLWEDGFSVRLEAAGVEDPAMYRFVQVYSPADMPFVCIEPWTGHPNALNTAGGVRWLEPGASESGLLRIRSECADSASQPGKSCVS